MLLGILVSIQAQGTTQELTITLREDGSGQVRTPKELMEDWSKRGTIDRFRHIYTHSQVCFSCKFDNWVKVIAAMKSFHCTLCGQELMIDK